MPVGHNLSQSTANLNKPSPVQKTQSAQMLENAQRTTEFLKSIAHAGRLMILCRLAEGPATVSQLEDMLDISQSSVSKQLSRLREDNFVSTTREGRSIYYSLSDNRARQIVGTLYEMFCQTS